MDHFERVMAAIEHRAIDRFPADIWCVDEVKERLFEHCGTREWSLVLDYLDIDGIVGLKPPYVGPALPDLGDGLSAAGVRHGSVLGAGRLSSGPGGDDRRY